MLHCFAKLEWHHYVEGNEKKNDPQAKSSIHESMTVNMG